jgi:hypothetical protein
MHGDRLHMLTVTGTLYEGGGGGGGGGGCVTIVFRAANISSQVIFSL